MNGEPTHISNPLPVSELQMANGIYKLKDMILSADSKERIMKIYPYYNIVMTQITRIQGRETSIRRYENVYDLFWQKYESAR